ncbi:MAG TPA: DEAD/DEAH box helicase, partial [Pirellulaceae bacterium]|nr:DEAD/DEAH box helicase [Pirellulaceae bacterium]
RLDELYSVVEFIDDRRLGPAFRFFPQHQLRDEDGALVGYRNLGELRDKLKPILLRRTREMVMSDLPERTDQLVRIPATAEQSEIHNANMRMVRALLKKPYLNEMDLLRLRKLLLMCRMSADSTTLVDKQTPGYSSKLETLAELFDQLFVESGRKVVLFSEWTSMLDLIEPLIRERGIGFERLDGSVPQRDRAARVDRFMNAPDCRLFITTNAGSTGLNLQAANTVINVDLPWNPAVLEQRIARAYRMGQQRPVQVFVLITEGTIEESLLGTLSTKRELALAALDVDSDVDLLTLPNASADLKQKLEVLIGARADGEVDGSVRREAEDQQERVDAGATRPADSLDQFAAVGGALLGAAAQLFGHLLPGAASAVASATTSSASGGGAPGTATSGESPATGAATPASANELIAAATSKLRDSIKRTPDGRPQLTLTLPDDRSLSQVATALAGVLQALGVRL